MAEENKTDNKEKAKNEEGQKITLEREYVVPLRREWLKVPRYRRAEKAVKALKEFIARHMKVYDRNLNKIKIDVYLNNEIRFRGMKKPLHKVKVKAIKYESGEVAVKLVQLPKHIEFELARKVKKEAEKLLKPEEEKKTEEKEVGGEKAKEEKKPEEKTEEQKAEAKEKEKSSQVATEQIEKAQAKALKHTTGMKKAPVIQRKALKKQRVILNNH